MGWNGHVLILCVRVCLERVSDAKERLRSRLRTRLRQASAFGVGSAPTVANELFPHCRLAFAVAAEVVMGSRGLGITKRALFNLLAVGSGEQVGWA